MQYPKYVNCVPNHLQVLLTPPSFSLLTAPSFRSEWQLLHFRDGGGDGDGGDMEVSR